MVIAYLVTLCVLSALSLYCSRKAASLERKVESADEDTRGALTASVLLQGNSNRHDPIDESRRRRKIDAAVAKLQLLEDRHARWDGRAGGLKSAVTGLLRFRGRLSPYILGAVDSLSAGATANYFGFSVHDVLSLIF